MYACCAACAARTTDGFIQTFVRFNSGTYNDQWMIVDLNRFNASLTALEPGTLWVLEQIPGYYEAKDMTKMLEKNTYWASYNRPYFEEVRVASRRSHRPPTVAFPQVNKRSMYAHYTQQHGEMFSYMKSPRARIFARDHVNVSAAQSASCACRRLKARAPQVRDVESMKHLMMQNKWQTDPFSKARRRSCPSLCCFSCSLCAGLPRKSDRGAVRRVRAEL